MATALRRSDAAGAGGGGGAVVAGAVVAGAVVAGAGGIPCEASVESVATGSGCAAASTCGFGDGSWRPQPARQLRASVTGARAREIRTASALPRFDVQELLAPARSGGRTAGPTIPA